MVKGAVVDDVERKQGGQEQQWKRTSERHACVVLIVGVHPHCASPQAARQCVDHVHVLRPDACRAVQQSHCEGLASTTPFARSPYYDWEASA